MSESETNTVFLYKEYNDDDAYGEEITIVFADRSDAVNYLSERFRHFFDISMEEYLKAHPEDEDDTISHDYVSYDTGNGYLFLVVEEKEIVTSGIQEEV